MRIILEPDVVLTSRQTFVKNEFQKFLDRNGVSWETDTAIGAQQIVESAGRVCYMSFAAPRPGGNEAYIKHIKEVGHGSVIEHAVWSFLIQGVSRSFTHELVRHRAGFAYSQLSQRYVDESTAEYVCPDIIANNPELFQIWQASVQASHGAYLVLVQRLNDLLKTETSKEARTIPLGSDSTAKRKTARQAARSVLPNATETKIFVTVNARAARHFIEMRASKEAEPEIRKVAYKIWLILKDEAPNLFGDYEPVPLPDGTTALRTQYRKV